MIAVACYLWKGSRDFRPEHVDALARMVRAHLPIAHRFVCVTDYPQQAFSTEVTAAEIPAIAMKLLLHANPCGDKFPVSYPRLWTFSEQARALGDLVLLLDVDCMVLRSMLPLFAIDADFVGWRVRPAPGNPRRFGGGTWLLRTGTRVHVWDEFIANPEAAIARAAASGYLGSDQAWISYKLSETEREWPEPSGIYCAQDYRKSWVRETKRHEKLTRRRAQLPTKYRAALTPAPAPLRAPEDAIILHMNGEQKPWTVDDPVVRQYWRPYFRDPLAC